MKFNDDTNELRAEATKIQSKALPTQSLSIKLIVNFVIPTFILFALSDESRLGPFMALLLALVLPVVFELYALATRRKSSTISLLAISGIIVTGVVLLFGLSENWLAIRRSAIYILAALALIVSTVIKFPLLDKILTLAMFDVERIHGEAARHSNTKQMQSRFMITSYLLAGLFTILGILCFLLTKSIITAPTGTPAFNAEYARLRIINIPVAALPTLVGGLGIFWYLLNGIKKLAKLEITDILSKH